MAPALLSDQPQELVVGPTVRFAFDDGTNGIISFEEQRTYDHIVDTVVGVFPQTGLTGN